MAKNSKQTIESDLIRELARLLDETGLSEIEYGTDSLSIRVAKQTVASTMSTTPAAAAGSNTAPTQDTAAASEASYADHPGAVKSPMVGVVYTSPDPNSAPFVQIGDQITEGQTLFLIEAMKVFNPIVAPKAGKVVRILVDTETPVEFGEPLAVIE